MSTPRGQIVNRSALLKEVETDVAALLEKVSDLDDLVVQFDGGEPGKRFIEIIPYVEIPTKAEILDASVFRSYGGNKRPLHIGLSVGHTDDSPGSLGAFLETGDGVAILSNSPVLALSGRAEKKTGFTSWGVSPDAL